MSRQIRKKSGTCIYHIILRGINDQKRSVFLCPSGSKRPEVEQPLCKAKPPGSLVNDLLQRKDIQDAIKKGQKYLGE